MDSSGTPKENFTPGQEIYAKDVVLGEGTVVHQFVNLYGCTIGRHSRVGAFVEIQRDAMLLEFRGKRFLLPRLGR